MHPVEAAPTRAVLARTFTYLYGAGGLLALGTLLLPHAPGRSTVGVAAPGLAAIAVAITTMVLFDRVPLVVFRWLPPLGTVLASAVMVSGDPASTIPYSGFYFWVILSAFYLFDARWAWANVVVVGIALAIVLEASPDVGDRALAWVMVMGALSVGGGMIGLLRARLEDVAAGSQRALVQSMRSERALAEAQRIAQVGSWELEFATGAFQGSAELYRILGLDEGAVTTLEQVLEALEPAERARFADAVRDAADGRVELESSVQLPRLGRRVLQTRARIVQEGGETVALVGTTQDVTERRAQEARLGRTLRRLRATIDIGLALGRERDPAGLLRLISERAQSLLQARTVYIQLADDEPGRPAAIAGEPPPEPNGRHADSRARATLQTPLAYHGVTHGVLVALAATDGPGFTPDDEEMLHAFASSAAVAVAGVKMVQEDALRRSIEAAERERRRFARELHDQTLQGLGALAMILESARADDPAVAANEPALRLIADEVENLRRIIADLRPALLDELGLGPALEALIQRVRADHGIEVDAAIDLPAGRVADLEPGTEQTIYRVVQEGLTNVFRHAGASRALVVVRVEDGAILVRIEDNGRGFDQVQAQGLGLVGMRERLLLLGATLVVHSGSGGTTLEASVPLDAD
ncbi:MAG TPA: ATP-binding protein [Thermoleophilaceae bacterium]